MLENDQMTDCADYMLYNNKSKSKKRKKEKLWSNQNRFAGCSRLIPNIVNVFLIFFYMQLCNDERFKNQRH